MEDAGNGLERDSQGVHLDLHPNPGEAGPQVGGPGTAGHPAGRREGQGAARRARGRDRGVEGSQGAIQGVGGSPVGFFETSTAAASSQSSPLALIFRKPKKGSFLIKTPLPGAIKTKYHAHKLYLWH